MVFERIQNRVTPHGQVTFVRQEQRENMFGNLQTYQYYHAPSKATALDWLGKQEINTSLFYVLVKTPEGRVAKDMNGFFDP